MSEGGASGSRPAVNLGWRVTFVAVGINLALGILYTWSVISKNIPPDWHWSEADKSWPYSIACLMFSLMMVPGGRLQDKLGPRLVASIGGVLVGAGMILASMTTSYLGYVLGFGLLAGAGIGFGYASATPPAVKWFPSARTGMIAGIVVSGFGLASVYAAPLAEWLIGRLGINHAMLTLGIAFLVSVVGLSQFLVPPPKGYAPLVSGKNAVTAKAVKKEDFGPLEMLSTHQFYVLWFMYACGAGAGLMIISKLAGIGIEQAGIKLGFLLVVALAVGNGAGRVVAGTLSDKIGRQTTMFGCFLAQAILMVLLSMTQKGTALATTPVLMIISALIGANYGANLSLFPSIGKDYYGLKNFGVNYGLIFTAWGVGGFLLSQLAGKLHDIYHSYQYSYYTATALLVLAALVTFTVKPPHAAVPVTDALKPTAADPAAEIKV